MYITRKALKVRIGQKTGVKNATPLEVMLYNKGYRCLKEKIEFRKISNKKTINLLKRSYYLGSHCIVVSNIVNHSIEVPRFRTI